MLKKPQSANGSEKLREKMILQLPTTTHLDNNTQQQRTRGRNFCCQQRKNAQEEDFFGKLVDHTKTWKDVPLPTNKSWQKITQVL
jgi:hypothetical protein